MIIIYIYLYHIQDNLHVVQLDVTSDSSVEALSKLIQEREPNGAGSIDILINNAGQGLAGCLEQVEVQQAKDLFEVNVWGPVRLMQALLPGMRKKG